MTDYLGLFQMLCSHAQPFDAKPGDPQISNSNRKSISDYYEQVYTTLCGSRDRIVEKFGPKTGIILDIGTDHLGDPNWEPIFTKFKDRVDQPGIHIDAKITIIVAQKPTLQ